MSLFAVTALLGLPATVSAAEPATAEEACAAAEKSREQADHYRALGGVGYKSGLVQRAEADAARYQARAQELSGAPATAEPAPAGDSRPNAPCPGEKPSIPCKP